jgi:hypothetical protein
MNPKILIATALIEVMIISLAIVLAFFVYPAKDGGVNVMILLPMLFLSSLLVAGVVFWTVLKNRTPGN